MLCADCQVGAKTCVTADVGNSCVSFFPPLQDCQVKAKKLKKKCQKLNKKGKRISSETRNNNSEPKIEKSKILFLRILNVAWNLSETLADKSDIWAEFSVFFRNANFLRGGKHAVSDIKREDWKVEKNPGSLEEYIFFLVLVLSKDFFCVTRFSTVAKESKSNTHKAGKRQKFVSFLQK